MTEPRTPINLITSSTPYHSLYNQILKSPLNVNSESDSEFSNEEPFKIDVGVGGGDSNGQENVEMLIQNLLFVLDDPKENNLNKSQVKTILQKSLITISHYKLQNEILRFENKEVNQRNHVENDLIKTQVDYLLKSPLKPSCEEQVLGDPIDLPKKTNFKINQPSARVAKPKTLKMVEKFNKHTSTKNINDFNNCIKVFHLEKN